MCGILGAVDCVPCPPLDREAFDAVIDLLAHRGPDGRGALHLAGCSLGHRRLSIIDPGAGGAQPMSGIGGDCHITFNGEIFNYRALRRELEARGCQFRSRTDTEVLIEAYRTWGPAALHRLRGMFAFGLWDARRRRLVLARDRYGIKPLFWAHAGDRFVFCSEPKGILAMPGFRAALDPISASAFLTLRQPLPGASMFAGMHQLLPGELLILDAGGEPRRSRWWQAPDAVASLHSPARGALAETVRDAVRHAMVSDVPVGAFLSGGLDSSVLVSEMAAVSDGPIETFTAGLDDPRLDESRYAAEVATHLGVRNTLVPVDAEQYLTRVRGLLRHKDQPLAMHNEVAVYELARVARERVAVVLSGEGADEFFWGYARIFRAPFDRRRLELATRLPSAVSASLRTRWGESDPAASPFDFFFARYAYFSQAEKLALLRPEMRAAIADDDNLRETLRASFDRGARRTFAERIAAVFQEIHLPGLLHMMDSMSMAASVELRVPYVDHVLAAAAARLPARDKLRWRSPLRFARALGQPTADYSERMDCSKWALRAAYQARLPAAVSARRKLVFDVPLNAWFGHGALGALFVDLLLDSDARCAQLIDQVALRRWMERSRACDPRFGRKAWMLLNLELWLREYLPEGGLLM